MSCEQHCTLIEKLPVDLNKRNDGFPLKAALNQNMRFVWYISNDLVQVFERKTSSLVTKWHFSTLLDSKNAHNIRVSDVIELDDYLAVSVNCHETKTAYICIMRIIGGELRHIFEFQNQFITCLCNTLSSILIGTEHGDVLALKLNTNHALKTFPKIIARSEISTFHVNVGNYTAVVLDDDTLMDMMRENHLDCELKVTALFYEKKLNSLFVGYNVGVWQIYEVTSLELLYTSAIYNEMTPITHFAIQEPYDDPRKYYYLWIIYSHAIDSDKTGIPLAAMYALDYPKDAVTGVQDFSSACLRFQMDLYSLIDGNVDVRGGYGVSLNVYQKDERDHNHSLCSIVWRTWTHGLELPETLMAVFDLNQWYKEQMPSVLRDYQNRTFIALFNLSSLLHETNVLNVNVNVKTIAAFARAQRLEEHYYPNSLAFDFHAITDKSMFLVRNFGVQRHLLHVIETIDVKTYAVGKCERLVAQLLNAGLSFVGFDACETTCVDRLLSIALENNLTAFLVNAALKWTVDVYGDVNANVERFLNWAKMRVGGLNGIVIELYTPLFDYSGDTWDENSIKLFNACKQQLSLLLVVLNTTKRLCLTQLKCSNRDKMVDQIVALKMICCHIEALNWLFNVGMLPECTQIRNARFNFSRIERFYREMRLTIKNGHSCIGDCPNCPKLFIDCLVEREIDSESVERQWGCVDSPNDFHVYPPRSLQKLLRIYFIRDVDIVYKHTIFYYVLLDCLEGHKKHTESLLNFMKFHPIANVSSNVIKLVDAFWNLDRGNYSISMESLIQCQTIAETNDFIKPWMHQLILNLLETQRAFKIATIYLAKIHFHPTNVDDILRIVRIYLGAGLFIDALELTRSFASIENFDEVQRGFFQSCIDFKLTRQLLDVNLTNDEKEGLKIVCRENNSDDLILLYHLFRFRTFDAYQHRNQIKSKTSVNKLFDMQFELQPKIMRKMCNYVQNLDVKKYWNEKQTERCTNLKVFSAITNCPEFKRVHSEIRVDNFENIWMSNDRILPLLSVNLQFDLDTFKRTVETTAPIITTIPSETINVRKQRRELEELPSESGRNKRIKLSNSLMDKSLSEQLQNIPLVTRKRIQPIESSPSRSILKSKRSRSSGLVHKPSMNLVNKRSEVRFSDISGTIIDSSPTFSRMMGFHSDQIPRPSITQSYQPENKNENNQIDCVRTEVHKSIDDEIDVLNIVGNKINFQSPPVFHKKLVNDFLVTSTPVQQTNVDPIPILLSAQAENFTENDAEILAQSMVSSSETLPSSTNHKSTDIRHTEDFTDKIHTISSESFTSANGSNLTFSQNSEIVKSVYILSDDANDSNKIEISDSESESKSSHSNELIDISVETTHENYVSLHLSQFDTTNRVVDDVCLVDSDDESDDDVSKEQVNVANVTIYNETVAYEPVSILHDVESTQSSNPQSIATTSSRDSSDSEYTSINQTQPDPFIAPVNVLPDSEVVEVPELAQETLSDNSHNPMLTGASIDVGQIATDMSIWDETPMVQPVSLLDSIEFQTINDDDDIVLRIDDDIVDDIPADNVQTDDDRPGEVVEIVGNLPDEDHETEVRVEFNSKPKDVINEDAVEKSSGEVLPATEALPEPVFVKEVTEKMELPENVRNSSRNTLDPETVQMADVTQNELNASFQVGRYSLRPRTNSTCSQDERMTTPRKRSSRYGSTTSLNESLNASRIDGLVLVKLEESDFQPIAGRTRRRSLSVTSDTETPSKITPTKPVRGGRGKRAASVDVSSTPPKNARTSRAKSVDLIERRRLSVESNGSVGDAEEKKTAIVESCGPVLRKRSSSGKVLTEKMSKLSNLPRLDEIVEVEGEDVEKPTTSKRGRKNSKV